MACSRQHFDVFNGDADGICALQQLRLCEPVQSTLVTGVKRHIRLVETADAPPGARVTVLDVAFGENRAAVLRLLERGCTIRYFDHHHPGDVPAHPALETHLDTSPRICTSLLMNRYLNGAARAWAVTGAFGDNLDGPAREAAASLALPPQTLEALKELGELINYNAYGEDDTDLHLHPAALYRALHPFADPLAFLRSAPEMALLRRGLAEDLASAEGHAPALDAAEGVVVLFPAEPWARRVQGNYANRLANAHVRRASAVGVTNRDGTLRLSVRAPLERPYGADALARRFPSGGGRAAAAGINRLPADHLPRFLAAFREAFAN